MLYKRLQAKKATKKLKIYAEVLGNEDKMKTQHPKKILPGFFWKKIKPIYQKLGKPFVLLSKWEEKVNVLHAP